MFDGLIMAMISLLLGLVLSGLILWVFYEIYKLKKTVSDEVSIVSAKLNVLVAALVQQSGENDGTTRATPP